MIRYIIRLLLENDLYWTMSVQERLSLVRHMVQICTEKFGPVLP